MEVLARVVEQHDADLAAVVLVDDARSRVDEFLDCESRTRSDSGVGAVGGSDGEARGDDGAVAGGDDDILAAGGAVVERDLRNEVEVEVEFFFRFRARSKRLLQDAD